MELKNFLGCYAALGLILLSPMYLVFLHAEVPSLDRVREPVYGGQNDTGSSRKDLSTRHSDGKFRERKLQNSLTDKDEPRPNPCTLVNSKQFVMSIDTLRNALKECDNLKRGDTPSDTSAIEELAKRRDKTEDKHFDKQNKKRPNAVDENKLERKKKERVREFWKRAIARNAKGVGPTKQALGKKPMTEEKHLRRSKRWEYYDTNYNWEHDGADYNTPDSISRKETKFEKWAKNWQKHALRFIFIFSFIMMFVCCCCAGCKKFCSRLCFVVCLHCKDWRDVCLNRDPTYRMMRKQADEYGIKLDYEEYKRIKHSYEQSLKKHGYSNVDISGR